MSHRRFFRRLLPLPTLERG
ncbi:hypothetical protein MPTK2_5g19850 [Marchantia polymorpha subsp. ruderalis]